MQGMKVRTMQMKQRRRALPLSLFLKKSISVCRPYLRRPVAILDQRDAMLRQAAVPLNARVLSLRSHVGCSVISVCGCNSSQGLQQALVSYTPLHCRRKFFRTSHLISYQFQKVGQADWHNFETYIKQSLKGLQNM